jgi:uncharacterized membrane protein YgcG
LNGSPHQLPSYNALVRRSLAVVLVAFIACLATSAHPALADEGWKITSFKATYTVRPDGVIEAVEDIAVDFTPLQKHGIFRYFFQTTACSAPDPAAQQPIYPCPEGADREYHYHIQGVTDFSGKAQNYDESTDANRLVLKIGDADTLVTGPQEYRITYTVEGALDAYSDHDELYWDVTSTNWPVTIAAFSMTVRLPGGATVSALCYQGREGSNERCKSDTVGSQATYTSTRALGEGQGVTIVAGWQKGLVAVAPPFIVERLTPADFFTLDLLEWNGMAVVALLAVVFLGVSWWRNGRDRGYRSLYYLTNDPTEGTKPLFGAKNIVVEFLPPDDLRPAEMGVILDERADTLDVTATIIDMAVRGYLHITELPKQGWFGHRDWKLTKQKEPEALNPFETKLFSALFKGGDEVELSDLRYTFATDLEDAKDLIYKDAIQRKWFLVNPETSRGMWMLVGAGMLVLGVGLSLLSGYFFGRALIPVALIPAGLVMLILSRSMGRRTAVGSEALRRVLGFRLYIATAETRRQEFNEQQNIFARYLPFAIVFGCVSKWAKAFEGLDDVASTSTASWYTGIGAFQVAAFSIGLQSFASSVSTTMASTHSSSSGGGSGFSGGGFSGGGGGGGGGGSW